MGYIRRHPVIVTAGAFGFLLVLLALLALPLRSVPGDANAAKTELTQAVEALKAGDQEVAFKHLDAGRDKVDDVKAVTDGFGASVWAKVPVFGSAVRDVRNLADALDELTSALGVAQEVYPKVAGDDAPLMSDGTINLDVVDELIAALGDVEGQLATSRDHLTAVQGDAPFVGRTAADAREEALAQVQPVLDALEEMRPMIERLPELMGASGEQKYLVAMMNPSEMKYSGGSMLTFSVMTLDEGEIKRGKTIDAANTHSVFRPAFWENVEGNPFASKYSELITHANVAPSWPVAGEETMRAWEWLRKREIDGVIALDMVAISRMLEVTGPLDVPGQEPITAENVVARTSGDYASFTLAQQAERKELNRMLIPAFMDQLFSGAGFMGTIQAVRDAGAGRHLATYFRDEVTQKTVADFGLAGDLSATDHDYLGFFTQSRVGSKADYYQQKDITLRATVAEDGSATVKVVAAVDNTGPLVPTGELSAYTDPLINANLGLFLPRDVTVKKARVVDSEGERKASTKTGDYFGRPYLQEPALIKPGERAEFRATYKVPAAAIRTGEDLSYLFDFDPHPTVTDARVKITVEWPEGWTPAPAEGWVVTDKGNSRWETDAVPSVTALKVSARRG